MAQTSIARLKIVLDDVEGEVADRQGQTEGKAAGVRSASAGPIESARFDLYALGARRSLTRVMS